MRLYKFPMVLLIGLLCVASRASAEKETHGASHSAGGGNAGGDHHAARNDEGRHGGRVDGKNQGNAVHIDRAPQGAARNGIQNSNGAVNNPQHHAAAPRNNPQHHAAAPRNNPGSANVRGGLNANIAGPNAWRYRQQNNLWWYWTPNNHWVYWNNGAWVPYGSLAVGGRVPYVSGYRGTVASGGYLGVTFDQQSPNVALIAQVSDNSPAANAGLQPGDAIRAINGESMQSPYQPGELIGRLAAGTEISLVIERDRQTSDVRVVLGQR